MTQIRYILLPLLLAGFACAQAQPIVKINAGTAGECDVISPTAPNIFTIDPQTGNVLITGTMVLPGTNTPCVTSSGGGGGGTFAFTTTLSATPAQFQAQSGSSSFGYSASTASACSVASSSGIASPSGSCPALTLSGGSCNNASPGTCTGSGTATEVTALASGVTSCAYTLTATCNSTGQSAITSTAPVTVTAPINLPTACQGLTPLNTGTVGSNWTQVGSTTVVYNGGTTGHNIDGTTYTAVWSFPGTQVAWPGLQGTNVKVSVPKNQFLSEAFVVPSDNSVRAASWSPIGSGNGTGASYAISTCPGDFGQTGTAITNLAACTSPITSQSSISVAVSSTPLLGTCTVKPGTTYYLNILSMADLPTNNSSVSSCAAGTCTPITSVNVTN